MNFWSIMQPIQRHFRSRRMAAFQARFRPSAETTILDVGGTPWNWSMLAPPRPCLTLLNREGHHRRAGFAADEDRMVFVGGDACAMEFQDRSFDIAFSNSVIEHVGTWERQQAFAAEVRRVGRAYYIQTPNRWFPVEPHYMTPLFQFVPRALRARLIRRCTVYGWFVRPDQYRCEEMVNELRLLTAGELRRLFPEAEIVRERFLGLTKSLVAVYEGKNP
jgi:hypothetical protein